MTGIVIGLLPAYQRSRGDMHAAATRAISGMLFGVTPTDLPTYAAVVALLVTIACGAVLIPARRAAPVDPMAALRSE